MKLLWGPLPIYAPIDPPHQVVEFGESGLPYQIGETWNDIFQRLPGGFYPDAVVWRYPDSNPWPIHHDCPAPLVAILNDWSLYFSAFREALDRCDYLVTDKLGLERLRSIGISHASYWPGYGLYPEVFYRVPDRTHLCDIAFVGNHNHDIHRARAQILARIGKLGDRYRVAIRTGIWGNEYAELLRQSRIVVNYSVRREMNLRGYETPACGALLFMEASNLEVRDFLIEGRECVLYREDNIEELLHHYLENEPLRARIAEAGWRRIQSETFKAHVASLVTHLESLDWGKLRGRPRRWPHLKEAERFYLYGRWLACAGPKVHLGHDELVKAVKADPTEPEHWNAVAVAEAIAAAKIPDSAERTRVFNAYAERHWLKLVELCPGHLLGWANLGFARLEFGLRETGVEALRRALDLLSSNPEQMVFREGCCFFVDSSQENKTDFNIFRVEWERLVSTCASDPVRLSYELTVLLRWQCARRLGDALLGLGRAEEAKDLYARAIAARRELEYAYAGLGRALEQIGQTALACAAYQEALERQPWDLAVRRRLVGLLNALGDSFGAAIASHELALLEKALRPPSY
ncbi:MAG: glycosyltransferase [Verrucomicrobia bacterium]|nr:glycosyltransferase [Verrucomicrobiota bacterium]